MNALAPWHGSSTDVLEMSISTEPAPGSFRGSQTCGGSADATDAQTSNARDSAESGGGESLDALQGARSSSNQQPGAATSTPGTGGGLGTRAGFKCGNVDRAELKAISETLLEALAEAVAEKRKMELYSKPVGPMAELLRRELCGFLAAESVVYEERAAQAAASEGWAGSRGGDNAGDETKEQEESSEAGKSGDRSGGMAGPRVSTHQVSPGHSSD